MSPKDIAAYAKVCRKHGISKLVISGVEIMMDLSRRETPRASKAIEAESPFIAADQPSDEELLFWSSNS